jgi:hypothetical protein
MVISPRSWQRAGRVRPMWTDEMFQDLLAELRHAHDQRYEQRFAAQEQAVAAALAAQKEAVAAAFSAAQQAVAKADMAFEKRLENTNEWRAAMDEYGRNLMPRTEAEQRIAALTEKLGELSHRMTESAGRSRGIGDSWQFLVASLLVVAAVVTAIIAVIQR